MLQFRKKPVVIEAIQVVEENKAALLELAASSDNRVSVGLMLDDGALAFVQIATLEGTMYGTPGDWIIKGVAGELYPCKPEIFAATYEPVEG